MNRLLIIGIDAMDPKVYRQLRGSLPNFSRLNFSELQTTIPPETPVAWTAACTGCNSGKYGIFDFITRNQDNYMPRLNLAHERKGIIKSEYESANKGTPFWRILTQAKIPCTVIRWPVTFPPEKITGSMLSGLGVVDIKRMLNSYSYYSDDAAFGTESEKEAIEDKIIRVVCNGNKIDTIIKGPFIVKKGGRKEAVIALEIELEDKSAKLTINGKTYLIKEGAWSEIIRAKFKLISFVEVSGIFQFYLESIRPFRMYMTSVMIDPENQAFPITTPKEYGRELTREIGEFYTLGMAEDTKAVNEGKLGKESFYSQVRMIEEQRTKMFRHEFKKFRSGVLAVVFDAGDRLNHIFWCNKVLSSQEDNMSTTTETKNIETTNIDEKHKDALKLPEEIIEYYKEKDKLIGEVMDQLENDDRLLILSDHGFNSFEKQVNLNNWLIENNYMKTNTNNPEGSLFDFVDWTQTRAYSVGFTSLFLNIKGREAAGSVSEPEQLLDEIKGRLLLLKDGKNRVFTNVYKARETFAGDYAKESPDLVVGFAQGYRMSDNSAIGGLDKQTIMPNKSPWQGDHLMDRSHVPGVLFTNFKIGKKKPEIIDIAPTVLKIMGEKIPDEMDGEALI